MSPMTAVMLQATLPLNPDRIIGKPAIVIPAAWYFGARICTGLHSEGTPGGNWLSLASRLLPLRLRCGAMAQLFEAVAPSGFKPDSCSPAFARSARPGIAPLSFTP
ncbi:hypothetical protein D3C81_1700140 [compost metagenome]